MWIVLEIERHTEQWVEEAFGPFSSEESAYKFVYVMDRKDRHGLYRYRAMYLSTPAV